ncbi:MAG: hypothetical protein WBW92_06955 [Rhodanobacteraceae bacterium]
MRLLTLLVLASLVVAAHAGESAASCGPQTTVPESQRLSNTLRWTTASEQDNFGYDVYRGNSKKGPFAKLTDKPVLGHGTTDETSNYSYRDSSIDPCKAYWYYVESISTRGERERFTPIFRAKPKRQSASPARPASVEGS